MISITTLDNGHILTFNDSEIAGLAGPRPHDIGPHTYVFGATPTPFATAEPVASLLARLNPNSAFRQADQAKRHADLDQGLLSHRDQGSVWCRVAGPACGDEISPRIRREPTGHPREYR